MSTESKTPQLSQIYLYLTGSCNLKCRHCWINPAYATKLDDYLSWSKLETVFKDAKEIGLQTVKLTGGEPFLHPEIIEIISGIKSLELNVTVETNGTLIGSKEAKAIKDAEAFISISIDGPTAEFHDDLRGVKGAFEEVLRGSEFLRKAGVKFQVISCLYRKNKDTLDEMLKLANDIGANSLKINPITGIERSEIMSKHNELLSVRETLDIHDSLINHSSDSNKVAILFDIPPAFKKLSDIKISGLETCAILNIIGILHNGRAGLCGIGEHVKELDFGDVFEHGIRKIWEENEILKQIREKIPEHIEGICGRCMFRNYCLGKCIAQTYYKTKNLFSGFTFCEEALDDGIFPESRIVKFQQKRD